jgi:hypothetical protein
VSRFLRLVWSFARSLKAFQQCFPALTPVLTFKDLARSLLGNLVIIFPYFFSNCANFNSGKGEAPTLTRTISEGHPLSIVVRVGDATQEN